MILKLHLSAEAALKYLEESCLNCSEAYLYNVIHFKGLFYLLSKLRIIIMILLVSPLKKKRFE